jgi:hypothetical protein
MSPPHPLLRLGPALSLLDPPWCYGAHPGSEIDVPRLALELRRLDAKPRSVVLSDIPDDFASLQEALALPAVAGAVAVACDGLDLWVGRTVEEALAGRVEARLSRDSETPLARFELRDPRQADEVLRLLEAIGTEP